MDATMWQGLVAIVIVAALFGNAVLKKRAQRERLQLIHQERLAAMEKGIPLPELPVDPPPPPPPPWMARRDNKLADPMVAALVFGILMLTGGVGGVLALNVTGNERLRELWSLPLPIALMGLGLILFYYLIRDRKS